MAKTKTQKKREKLKKQRMQQQAGKIKGLYADIDNIHTNVAVLFEIAKRNENKICIAKAHEIYSVHQKLIKRKKKCRDEIESTLTKSDVDRRKYVIRSQEIFDFMKKNNFKCFSDKKYLKLGKHQRGADIAYYNDLLHVYTMETSLNMRQAYLLTKEILRLKDLRIKEEVLKVKNKVFK